MAIEGTSHMALPGTALYALLSSNHRKLMNVTTAVGQHSGLLEEFNSAYIKLLGSEGSSQYILLERVVSFSFSENNG